MPALPSFPRALTALPGRSEADHPKAATVATPAVRQAGGLRAERQSPVLHGLPLAPLPPQTLMA